jgi:predicted component of type VI protein secretion system
MPHFLLRNTVISDRRLPLPGRVVVLGRSLDADVPVPHDSVSRRHALLEATPDGFVISDLGSHNGTFVGEKRLAVGERIPVPLGGIFRLGQVAIILAQDEPLDALGEPLRLAPEPAPASAAETDPVPAGATATGADRPARAARGRRRRKRRDVTASQKAPPPPSAQRRAANLRKRRRTFFWAGLAATAILLALAAFFIYRIATQSRDKADQETVEEPGGSSGR